MCCIYLCTALNADVCTQVNHSWAEVHKRFLLGTLQYVYCCSAAFRCVLTQWRKDISNDLREAIVAAHQSGKGYKAISKLPGVRHSTEKKIIHKWKTFRTAVNLPSKFTPRFDRAMLRETAKIENLAILLCTKHTATCLCVFCRIVFKLVMYTAGNQRQFGAEF